MTEVSLSQANFTQVEESRWDFLSEKATTVSMRLVQVGNLPSLLTNGLLTFSPPGSNQIIQAKTGYIKEESNGDYVWWANFTNSSGYVGVSKAGSRKQVFVQKDSLVYHVYPLSDRYNAWVETARTTVGTCETAPDPELYPNITSTPGVCNEYNDCSALVTVLVLVTPEAIDALPVEGNNLEAAMYLYLGLHSVNFALWNSGVYGKTCRFIIEPYEFDFHNGQSPYEIINDLTLLRDDVEAQARKAANRADIMVLLTDFHYSDALGGVLYDPNDGYNVTATIVSVEYMIGHRHSFAHEMGHNFYLSHQRAYYGNPDTDNCNFGWVFEDQSNIEHGTIMSVPFEESIPHILNYSNPDVMYNGEPTGTEDDNNATKASITVCQQSNNYNDLDLQVAIQGPDILCNETGTYTADIINQPATGQPGSPPFTYYWAMDDDPFFNPLTGDAGTYLGNTSSVQIQSPSNQTFWLLLVVCGTGDACASYVMQVESPCLTGGDDENLVAPDGRREPVQSLKLSPNPARDYLQITFEQPVTGLSEYAMVNSIGQVVLNGSVGGERIDVSDINLPREMLPSGLYQFTLHNGSFFSTQTIFIQH